MTFLFSPSIRIQPDFSQTTLNKFGMTYIHDDSETTSDSFTFRAWVAPLDLFSSSTSSSSSAFSSDSSSSFSPQYSASSSSFSSLDEVDVKDNLEVTETFNITVTPVNDQPPLIRSRAPSMKVVVGERVVLGPDNLQVRLVFNDHVLSCTTSPFVSSVKSARSILMNLSALMYCSTCHSTCSG